MQYFQVVTVFVAMFIVPVVQSFPQPKCTIQELSEATQAITQCIRTAGTPATCAYYENLYKCNKLNICLEQSDIDTYEQTYRDAMKQSGCNTGSNGNSGNTALLSGTVGVMAIACNKML
eukprot:Pgem_evm1s12159